MADIEPLEPRQMWSAAPAPLPAYYCIDAGGKTYTDHSGQVWAADKDFIGGGAYYDSSATVGVDAPLLDNRRTGTFNYVFPIANGTYTVTLLFADSIYAKVGQRVFNVTAQGRSVLSKFDITASGGAGGGEVVRSLSETVSAGQLTLGFTGTVGHATVSGIKIVPAMTTPTPTPAPAPTPTPTPSPTATPVDFNKISWTTGAPSPVDRSEALTASIDGKLYVFGGFEDLNGPETRSDVYDPGTNTWAPIANLPQKLTHVGVATLGDNVYFAGGYVGDPDLQGFVQTYCTANCYVYNAVSNQFTALPSLPIPRAAGALVAVGHKLHYFGGFNIGGRTDSTLHFVLDLSNLPMGWQSASPMPLARNHMAYEVFNEKVYLIAGQTGTDAGLVTRSDVQIYDPENDTWSKGANIPLALSHISSSTYVVDDRILVLGGETANGIQSNTVFAYTPATDTWQNLSPLPAARLSGVSRMINGKIIFTTGGNTNTTFIGTPIG